MPHSADSICESFSPLIRSVAPRFALEAAGLYLDCSKNRIDAETLQLLVALALDCDLPQRIVAHVHATLDRMAELAGKIRTGQRVSDVEPSMICLWRICSLKPKRWKTP